MALILVLALIVDHDTEIDTEIPGFGLSLWAFTVGPHYGLPLWALTLGPHCGPVLCWW